MKAEEIEKLIRVFIKENPKTTFLIVVCLVFFCYAVINIF
jgi:hypothetical protein